MYELSTSVPENVLDYTDMSPGLSSLEFGERRGSASVFLKPHYVFARVEFNLNNHWTETGYLWQ